MNFFESQDAARRSTRSLVALFVLAVAAIVLSIWLALGLAATAAAAKMETTLPWNPWSLESLGWVAAVTLVIVASGSFYKTLALRTGGPAVARLLGARPVDPNTRDLKERRLLNVVEEMSIAAGMAVPSVYVLDGEAGINAFAAGFSPNDTIVSVTQGTLDYLSRDELQGVIGHELSHALNGDTHIKLRLIGVLHGILVIAVVGRILVRVTGSGSSRDSKGDPRLPIVLFGLGLMAIGGIGVLFGRMIKAAVSRQRELLADAASVQFTRNPAGIAGALKKIGGLAAGSKIENAHAEEANHLFFGQVFSAMASMMATHPPLEQRIRRLEPHWDGSLPPLHEEAATEAVDRALEEEQKPRGFADARGMADPRSLTDPRKLVQTAAAVMAAGMAGRPAGAPPPSPPPSVEADPKAVTNSVGRLDAAHISYAEQLIAALPETLRKDVHEPMSASAVVFALLLDRDAALRQRQLEELSRSVEPPLHAETLRVTPMVDACAVETRLPLLDLALPTLRRMSEPQFRRFSAAVGRLMAADARLSLFEFTIQRVLMRHLERHFDRQPPPKAIHATVAAVGRPASVLLSALAYAGQPRAEAAATAFEVARQALGANGTVALCTPAQCGVDAIGRALADLAQSAPMVKQKLLEACAATVTLDGRITVREGELLRAVADSLDCPLPPFVPGQTL
jgi:Zn-dependent protease with chaperone function